MQEIDGGRFDFDDGGSYVGEWRDGRAHGLGIATGPDNQGEYSGEWQTGFESRGVYMWPSGNIYCGGWMHGKRHGEGVQVKGRWIYQGAFTTGFCGRTGVKQSLTSSAKYEGEWHLNQFDGLGVETNSDGSIYSGAWSKGMRQGLGVRRSAPFSQASEMNRTVRAAQSQNSIPSGAESDRGWRGTGIGSVGGGSGSDIRTDERRSGFVLRGSLVSFSASVGSGARSASAGLRSPTPVGEKRSFFKRGLFQKLRKQKSTGDISMVGGQSMSAFSTQTGCGGGNLFHSRGRRFGSSLRSTLSGSSQMTTKSLARGELHGNGLVDHNPIDEVIGPDVTETYSGQWNGDRRCGYGVAHRSDGLRYVGEWFNNKKDGYGVTHNVDGSKEEGRYKENILVHVLNRKSKLFLIRYSRLRDAVEDACKKAEEASKKAFEISANSRQKVQTANSFAQTATVTAQQARQFSDRAREIARLLSPDFAQLGLIWEKQNTLLKPELFGILPTPTAEGASTGYNNQSAMQGQQYYQQQQDDQQLLMASGQPGTQLEVSGGSRQGSFRSSNRKKGQQSNGSAMHQAEYSNDASGMQNNRHDPSSALQVETGSIKASFYPSRSPAGRPMSRAATTGVTGAVYSQADQRQMAQHMAQHPHSPYLMASTSRNLDDIDDPQVNLGRISQRHQQQYPQQASSPYGNQPRLAQATFHNQIQTVAPMHAAEIQIARANLVQPTTAQYAAVQQASMMPGPARGSPGGRKEKSHHRHTTSKHKSRNRTQSPGDDHDIHNNHHHQHERHHHSPQVQTVGVSQASTKQQKQQKSNSLTPHVELLASSTLNRGKRADFSALDEKIHRELEEAERNSPRKRMRRRTLPSIMTEPPARPVNPNQQKRTARYSPNLFRRRQSSLGGYNSDDQAAFRSDEHLRANAAAIFIIENGIRKRVQASARRAELSKQATSGLGNKLTVDLGRPEWTVAYDPYRPAMESTGIINNKASTLQPRSQHLLETEPSESNTLPSPRTRPQAHSPTHYLPPPHPTTKEDCQAVLSALPRNYRFESQLSLTGEKNNASMPNLLATGIDEDDDPMTLIRRQRLYGPGLRWDEIAQLHADRRYELDKEAERRRRGEIVIRLADIKDWMRANVVIVFVILINASLVFLFFNILTSSTSTSTSGPQGSRPSTGRANQPPPASPDQPNLVQMAQNAIGSVVKANKKKKP